MKLSKAFLYTDYNGSSYASQMVIFTKELNIDYVVRVGEVGALRGLSQRRIIYSGGKFVKIELIFEIYPEFFMPLFNTFAQYVVNNNKRVYSLTNSNVVPMSNYVAIAYETLTGQKVQTNLGVLSGLEIQLPVNGIATGKMLIYAFPGLSSIQNLPSVGSYSLLTPANLTGKMILNNQVYTLQISNFQLQYQREINSKATTRGILEDIFIASQTVDFRLEVLDSVTLGDQTIDAVSLFESMYLNGQRAALEVWIVNLYVLKINEFVIRETEKMYTSKFISLGCSAIGENYTQIQLTQL
ncbi:MAG: hypothetical protein ABDH59_08620 [Fervidobacterium sp.]